MKRLDDPLRSIESVATALWVGSSTGFAFLSPIAFHATPDKHVFAGITEASLDRLARVAYAAGGIAVAAAVAQRRPVRAALGLTALTLVTYQQRTIVPAMRGVPHGDERYTALHRRSTRVYGAALLLGYAQIALAALG